MKPGQKDQKQAPAKQSHFTKGLGSLANGVIAAILVGLTLLVAVVLATGEQNLVASQIPTTTATPPPPTATPSPLPTSEPPTVQSTPSAVPSPSPLPSLAPSHTPTITPTPQPSHTAVAYCNPPSYWRLYTVQRGESLTSLAWRYSTSEYNLIKVNCLTSRTLRTGQRLYVPNVPARQACGRPAGWVAYTVQRGDTLYRLALRYGTTVARLRLANCLTGDTIYTGRTLWVPYVKPVPTSHPPHTRTPTKPVPTRTSTATAGPSPTASPTSEESATPSPTPSDTTTVEPVTDTPVPDTPTASPEPTSVPTTPVPPTATDEPTPEPPPTQAPTATPRPPTSTPLPPPPPPPPPSDTPIPTETS